jgi:hypothetical protein
MGWRSGPAYFNSRQSPLSQRTVRGGAFEQTTEYVSESALA